MRRIPSFFSDSVAAIGTDRSGERQWIATGFLYGMPIAGTQPETEQYEIFLVTNRHVFENDIQAAFLRFNPLASEPARDYPLRLRDDHGTPLWTAHPRKEVDVAVIRIRYELLERQAMKVAFIKSDQHAATTHDLRKNDVSEGDSVFVLGFPMGLTAFVRNVAIVRAGCIARIQDLLDSFSETFLVDAAIFPGNSGGPVLLQGEQPHPPRLVGLVSTYIPYSDVAVSQQSGAVRVVFMENSELAAAHPVDHVNETIMTVRANRAGLGNITTVALKP